MKTILCWAMVIGAILALASPIIANILVAWHEKKEKEEKERHTCAICKRVQKDPVIICDNCFREGI